MMDIRALLMPLKPQIRDARVKRLCCIGHQVLEYLFTPLWITPALYLLKMTIYTALQVPYEMSRHLLL